MQHVIVPISTCLGLARGEAIGAPVNLVLQRADGALHVLAMSGPTALAMVAAIRADVSVPIEFQHLVNAVAPRAPAVAPGQMVRLPPDVPAPTISALEDLFTWANRSLTENARLRRVIRWAFGLAVLTLGFVVMGLSSGRL